MSDDKARIACPRCGCTHVPVTHTTHAFGKTCRRRKCRNCLRAFMTTERIGRVQPDEPPPPPPTKPTKPPPPPFW